MNDNSMKAVVDRHNIIQEAVINLRLKKEFLKNKEKLKKTLIEKQKEHYKINNQRKELRLVLENEYMVSLNKDNAIEMINNRKKKI